ncbi:cupin domain-containing protein [Streptomyces zingiberis]|uniref:cupin domain-containing protein n=1 Tax=Streptomyces zingiberis TaxID=2053010 RepID=UPI002893534A|nr:cupin domain-containing protein [Streptomyces zingiberis]
MRTPGQQVTVKVTGEQSRVASSFEVVVPPGFDVGAHVHARSEELFYVLDGELDVLAFEPRVRAAGDWRDWESSSGLRTVRARPGTVIVVPPGCPHAFANSTSVPARMFFQSSPPPDHERYFDELLDLLGDGVPDPAAVAALRARHDTEQLTPLRLNATAGIRRGPGRPGTSGEPR